MIKCGDLIRTECLGTYYYGIVLKVDELYVKATWDKNMESAINIYKELNRESMVIRDFSFLSLQKSELIVSGEPHPFIFKRL